jgi:hypothetical protein
MFTSNLFNAYKILVGEPEGKRPLRISRRRWEDNIKVDLRKIRCKDSSGSEQGPAAGSCEHGKVLFSSVKWWEFLEWLRNYWFLKKDSAPWS